MKVDPDKSVFTGLRVINICSKEGEVLALSSSL